MKVTSRLLALVAAIAISAQVASADTLHSFCTGATPACLDNGTVTPTTTNPPNFGFTFKGKSGGGDLWLVLLSPNNFGLGAISLTGSNTTNSLVAGSLFSNTPWTSGNLTTYLSSMFSSFTPPGPLNAYLPSTQAVDASATGYFAYLFNFGAITFPQGRSGANDPTFLVTSGALQQGSVVLALLTDAGTHNVNTATPQSAALFEGGAPPLPPPPPPPVIPEPSSFVLLGTGLMSVAGGVYRRFRMN